jgi:predicted permease
VIERRLVVFWNRRRVARDFNEEIDAHLRLEADALQAEGVSRDEAERRARAVFGSTSAARERFNLRHRSEFLENIGRDLRYGLRMMVRNRAVTAVAVLTLACGIAACATVFTWINAVLLQPLGGVADPARLVTLYTVTSNGQLIDTSYLDSVDFRDHLKLFEGVAVTRPVVFSLGRQDHAERVWGELVSGNFFAVLGVRPEMGCLFLPSEYGEAAGGYPVVVISDRYWRSHYGADPSIVGKTILINQHELTVVGIAAPAFHGSMPATWFDVWIPYMEQPVLNGVPPWMLRDRHTRNMMGIARLKPGVTADQARLELKTLAERMAVANADVSEGLSATIVPLWKSPDGPQGLLLGPLSILMAICFLVLIIVCANVANLLLAHATAREKEFGARLALGATRARVVRQVLTECILLTGAGAVIGLTAAPFLGHTLRFLMPPGAINQLISMNTSPNFMVLSFTAGVCVLCALAAGLLPALHVSRIPLSTTMNSGGRSGTAGRPRNRMHSMLVAAEVAVALVTLVGAGLFARGFQQTLHIDPGFDPDHVLVNQFYLSTNGYSVAQRLEFCRRLTERIESAPAVTGVAYSDGIPLGFEESWWEELTIEGYAQRPNENMNVFRNVISPGYLPLMRIPVLDGRNFVEQDNENAPMVMIVNQAFALRYFAGRSPIGHMVHGWGKWFRIIGVARNSKYHYLNETTPPYFYVSFRQIYRADMNLAFYVRTRGDPEQLLSMLRSQTRGIDPNVTVFDAAPLKEYIGASLYPQKIAASLMTIMAALALLLAAVGLYSAMAYSVAQRTQEIGVRMALGARPGRVLLMVVRQGLAITGTGLAVGVGLTWVLARMAASVSATNSAMGANQKVLQGNASDPLIYIAAIVFLSAVAILAAYFPARRAASVEPMEALRSQ